MRASALLLAALAASACGGGSSAGDGPDAPAPAAAPAPVRDLPAPWGAEPLPPTRAPDAALRAWARAENRSTCALLAPTVTDGDATPRQAQFGGGWGVAWDLPDRRSAWGVAGTGVGADEPAYHDWPHHRTWADGSSAGWGPEGGSGPKELAYLRIPGQGCLYNVWSYLGEEHLERLLGRLRFVHVPGTG